MPKALLATLIEEVTKNREVVIIQRRNAVVMKIAFLIIILELAVRKEDIDS